MASQTSRAPSGIADESHFERLFDASPIPTWEQDYTGVRAILTRLRSAGVTDLVSHLENDSEQLSELVGAVRVRRANRAAIDTYAYDPDDHDGRISLTSDGSRTSFIHQVAAVWDGRTEMQYEYMRDPDHPGPSQCALHWVALEMEAGPDYSHVVVSVADIGARSSLTEQLQRRGDQLELLHEINAEIASQLDIDIVLGTITSGVKRIFDASWVELILLDEELDRVLQRVHDGLTDIGPDAAELREGIGGWVLQSGNATTSAAAQSDPRNAGTALQRAIAENTGAVVVAPLVVNGSNRGTLAAGYPDGSQVFTRADRDLVALLAAHASLAVNNAISVERIEGQIAARDQLAAAVSHELRTPLTAVAGLASALVDSWSEIEEDERRSLVSVIADESADATRIIADLLHSSRSKLGPVDFVRQPMELRTQAEAVLRSLDEAGSRISLSGGPVMVTADPLRVRQILRNLITNALRYGGEEIAVSIEDGEADGVLNVIDNGPGVEPDLEAALFAPFTRGSSPAPASIGLGLSVAKDLAEAMGGRLDYKRSQDRTVFAVTLPGA